MYAGRDFRPSDNLENERYTFDFVNDIQAGDTINGAAWTCAVATKSPLPDSNAAAHIVGAALFSGTATTQRVSGLIAGVIYVLTATVTTLGGDTISLWSHVECKAPS